MCCWKVIDAIDAIRRDKMMLKLTANKVEFDRESQKAASVTSTIIRSMSMRSKVKYERATSIPQCAPRLKLGCYRFPNEEAFIESYLKGLMLPSQGGGLGGEVGFIWFLVCVGPCHLIRLFAG